MRVVVEEQKEKEKKVGTGRREGEEEKGAGRRKGERRGESRT